MAKELLIWTCPQCGKVLTSLYQKQLDNNKAVHLLTHKSVGCVQSDHKDSISVPEETTEVKQ